MEGWIKLHRKLLDNDIWKYDNTAWRIFEYLLLNADYKTGCVNKAHSTMINFLDIPKSTLSEAIKRLKNAKMVNTTPNPNYTTYSICNWDKYQEETEHPAEPTPNQRRTNAEHIQEVKKTRSKETKPSVYKKMITDEEKSILIFFKKIYEIKTELPKNNEQIQSAKWLLKEKGFDKTLKAIQAAWSCRGQEYAPSINSLIELKEKYGKLEEYYHRKRNSKPKVGILDDESEHLITNQYID